MESSSEPTILPSQSPEPPNASKQAQPHPNRRIGADTWIWIDHTANLRRGSKISPIWRHGKEYINMSDPDSHRWFCSKCNKSIMIQDSKSTSNIRRHLKNSHGITIDRADEAQNAVEDEGQ